MEERLNSNSISVIVKCPLFSILNKIISQYEHNGLIPRTSVFKDMVPEYIVGLAFHRQPVTPRFQFSGNTIASPSLWVCHKSPLIDSQFNNLYVWVIQNRNQLLLQVHASRRRHG